MIKYIIPHIPPSINDFIGRKNIWEYRAEKAHWKNYCYYNCIPRPSKPINKAKVIITFYFDNRRKHDADNYQKFLLDGLVTAGIIYDDDFEHLIVTCKGEYDKENPRTEIEVYDLQQKTIKEIKR